MAAALRPGDAGRPVTARRASTRRGAAALRGAARLLAGRGGARRDPDEALGGTARRRSAALATAALVGSYLAVRSGRSAGLDRRAAKALATPLGRRADVVIGTVTDLGSVYGIVGVAGALALRGHRRLATDVAVSGAAAWTAAQACKPLVDRERPYLAHGAERLVAVPAGSSWPSGHVAVASAMGAAITPRLEPLGRRGVHLAVAGVAASRCYVGVHHLTDVIAGWGVGTLVGQLARR